MSMSESADSQVQIAYRHVRSAIIRGELLAGEPINQVEMSRQLQISRTPVREAMRMLQSEGLLEAQHQFRMRVSSIRPSEVDSIYAERILIEALAIGVTAERADSGRKKSIERAFLEMKEAAAVDLDSWESKHAVFHRELTACASREIQATLANFADRAERYRRAFMLSAPNAMRISETEHELILEAVILGAPDVAMSRLSNHLARTALTLLSTIEPRFEPVFIRRALNLVRSGEPEPLRLRPVGRKVVKEAAAQ